MQFRREELERGKGGNCYTNLDITRIAYIITRIYTQNQI